MPRALAASTSRDSFTAPKLISIAVFCGSRSGRDAKFISAAREVGEALAAHRITIVYGGAWVGTMGALADSALARGGDVVGVIPETMAQQGLAHQALTRLITTTSMNERMSVMITEADGCIVLPGGVGTLHEFFEVYTSAFLGDYKKPIGLLNVRRFYDTLLQHIDQLVDEGFLSLAHKKTLVVSDDIESLLAGMREFRYSARNKLADHEENARAHTAA